MTFERFKDIIPDENVFIVTNRIYSDIVLEQIPEIKAEQILLEPIRRNTAPCIAYATYKIREINPEANIIVVPSDHLITNETEYIRIVKEGLRFVSLNDSLLTLGMKPTRPETGYGYIQIGKGGGELRKVKTFTEKPNLEMAKIFFQSKEFYWNSGMFLWRVGVIINAFETLLPDVANKFEQGRQYYGTPEEQEFIDRIYPICPNISIDYGIMEKAANVYVMMADFGWSDLGTWSSLYELSPKDAEGNAVLQCEAQLYDCKNNLIALPKGRLAVIDGLEGYLVAQANDVLLICKKDEEAKIRQFVNDVEEKHDSKYV
jgi:mannose-1-phosphate guanylyltransferase